MPRLFDYLRYRVILGLLRANKFKSRMTDAEIEALVNNRDQWRQQLLAPEVIAGQKMDLNRPFGDGVDNNNNGVVDEPLEAGEPYLDKIADGKYTSGDPFIDLNGNGKYDGPNQTPPQAGFDQLWQQLTASGAIQQAIGFDYTNGHGVALHPAVAASAGVSGYDRGARSRIRRPPALRPPALLPHAALGRRELHRALGNDLYRPNDRRGNDRARAQNVDGHQDETS